MCSTLARAHSRCLLKFFIIAMKGRIFLCWVLWWWWWKKTEPHLTFYVLLSIVHFYFYSTTFFMLFYAHIFILSILFFFISKSTPCEFQLKRASNIQFNFILSMMLFYIAKELFSFKNQDERMVCSWLLVAVNIKILNGFEFGMP